MSIRPIDFQVLVPKTQQLSQENQILNDKLRSEHESLIQQDKIKAEQKLNKVNEFENKDRLNMREKQDKNNKGHSKNSDKKNQKDKKDGDKKNNNKKFINKIGNNIDIKI